MKTVSVPALIASLSILLLPHAFGQGALTPPPGPPVPTMKSLQEIWDKVGALETRATVLETQNTQLQTANSQLQRQLGLLTSATVNFAWVASTVSLGVNPSLAFGPDGQPAIAFNGLQLARFDGATWAVTAVPGASGSFPSLAFGPDGYPAIAYLGPSGRLYFARFDGTAWSVTLVETQNSVGLPSLAFGPNGLPGIAYNGNTSYILKYAAFDGSAWTNTSMSDPIGVKSGPALAIGPDNRPAIVYRADRLGAAGEAVVLARVNAGTWTTSVVANAGTVTNGPAAIAFGPDGQPAVAYGNNQTQRLYVGRFNGTVWTPSTVSVTQTSERLSLAFGLDGQPALAYTTLAYDLLLARYTGSLDGPAWVSTVVDSAGDVGFNSSLAFGPDGQPAIAYGTYGSAPDYAPASIKFARKGVFKPLP